LDGLGYNNDIYLGRTMQKLKKNKKGLEGGGFNIIIAIIILLVAAGVIIWVIQQSTHRADEKSQIELCRTSNGIQVGVAKGKPAVVPFSSPSLCGTIYKTEGKQQVPTSAYTEKYDTPEEAAAAEIVDMIKNCWYMWLEGSEKEIFSNYWLWFGREDGCAVCYVFKINGNEVEGLDYYDIQQSMERAYSAKAASDNCVPSGGGFFEDKSRDCGYDSRYNLGDPSGWREISSKTADAVNKKCCIREDAMDECGNKGGKCSEEPDSGGRFVHEYSGWSCPEANQKCYVTGENYITYNDYITSYGSRGGALYFEEGLSFERDTIAVTFYSYRGSNSPVGTPTFIKISTLGEAMEEHKDTGKCEILI
jgi:hypothetical protein